MSDFYTAMQAAGLEPVALVPDGKWHRCKTVDKPARKNGAYLLDPTGRKGVFKNWATDLDWHSWSMDGEITQSQLRDMRRFETAARVEKIAADKAAIASAVKYFKSLPILTGHPYLGNKGLSMLGCSGLKQDGRLMVIPICRDEKIVSLQTIDPDGKKLYRAGCHVKGGVFVMERSTTLTCFVEGFATGLAIFQALPCRVVVCFDAGNLVEVSKHYRSLGLGVVCADNDHETEARTGSNKGLEAGRKAAEQLGCGIAYPQGLKGSDWADAVKEYGPDALRWIARKINVKAKPFRRSI